MTTRREALAAPLALAAAGAAAPAAAGAADHPHAHDWDWLVGDWNVKHERLKGRLVGSTTWETFNGSSRLWLTLGGLGTVDDNVLELPDGTYRAMGVRAFDAASGLWAIWWIDPRNLAGIDPPVRGGFKDGVGVFECDDALNGKPIRVRYRWSDITATSAQWDQAFSPDAGATWEVNWRMAFTRKS